MPAHFNLQVTEDGAVSEEVYVAEIEVWLFLETVLSHVAPCMSFNVVLIVKHR